MEGVAMRVLISHCFFYLLLTVPSLAVEPDNTAPQMILVVGAAGASEFGEQFTQWSTQWAAIGRQAGAKVVEIGNDTDLSVNDVDRLKAAIESIATEGTSSLHPHWIVFIGHGTFQANVAKFNLRGPDIAVEELAKWLKSVDRGLVIVNVASSSGPFVNALSGKNRIVVTATKSGEEHNFARFGAYLPKALGDPASDLDHDDEVSLLEAVLKATSETGEFYAADDRLRTEHAIVDDNGDKLGTPAEMLGSVLRGTPLKATTSPKSTSPPPQLDGDLAARAILIPAVDVAKLSLDESAARAKTESELQALRKKKSSLSEDEYFTQLERLMLELAKIYQSAEKRQELPVSSP